MKLSVNWTLSLGIRSISVFRSSSTLKNVLLEAKTVELKKCFVINFQFFFSALQISFVAVTITIPLALRVFLCRTKRNTEAEMFRMSKKIVPLDNDVCPALKVLLALTPHSSFRLFSLIQSHNSAGLNDSQPGTAYTWSERGFASRTKTFFLIQRVKQITYKTNCVAHFSVISSHKPTDKKRKKELKRDW